MRLKRMAAITAAMAGLVLSIPAASDAAVTRVAASNAHACALIDSTPYCWGSNANGRLGAGPAPLTESAFPVAVDTSTLPAGVSFTSLTAGQQHTCGLTSAGTVYCWGRDFLNALGDGDSTADQPRPVPIDVSRIPAGTTFTAVTAGRYTTCALTTGGSAYCWGDGISFGTGDAQVDGTRPELPVTMSGLPAGETFATIDSGDTQACGVTTGGKLYCWGQNARGTLGVGDTNNRTVPTPVNVSALPAGTTWASVAGYERHTCALTTAGAAYCWGTNDWGQVGNGEPGGTVLLPVAVNTSGLPAGTAFKALASGGLDDNRFTCAVTTTDATYCWGGNDFGQLGAATTPSDRSASPVAVNVPFSELATGTRFTCGVAPAGAVSCWGQGTNGKLGYGGTGNRATPTPVKLRKPGEMRITEWMYNTAGDSPGEWVELTNVGEIAVDLAGWRYDDDSANPAIGFDLSGFGVVEPGESVVFTEVDPAGFREDWDVCQGTKVIGPYGNNLGRADQINIFNASGALVDRLTYGDQTVGGPRTNGVSAWAPAAALGANDARQWVRSTVGDGEGSRAAASGSIGSPGKSTRAIAAFNPCAGKMRLTEWMYNTAADDAGEWIELTNVGSEPVNMAGYSYDDDSRNPGVFNLSGAGVVEPGESIVFTEIAPATFRDDWQLCSDAKVLGPYSNNLGRSDEINIFDGAGELVDRLRFGDSAFPGSVRTQGVGGWVSAAGLGKNDVYAWTAATVGDVEGSYEAASGSIGSPGRSTRGVVPFDRCATEPGATPEIESDQRLVAGSVGDADNPTATLTLTPKDGGAAVEQLTVAVASSNPDVLPVANVKVTGTGAQRTVTFDPLERGTAGVTFTVTDPDGSRSTAVVTYAASAPAPDASGVYYHRVSDASSALSVGGGYMLLLNDETNTIFLHREDRTGVPVKTWTFTPQQLGTGSEIDYEGIARSGDLLVLTGSHGNNRDGEVRPERRTFVAATITGSGAATEVTFRSRYNGLWAELRAWDQTGAHGLGANRLGFVEAMQDGVQPNPPDGFNVEGLEFAPDGTSLYLGLRAPTVEVEGEQRALVVPVRNTAAIVDGSGPAQFGAPILMDLDGRSIRELRRNARNEYLLIAGPSDENPSYALYTWDGDPAHQPKFNLELPQEDLETGGTWESIAAVPEFLLKGAPVRLVADSGDTDFYGTGPTKDIGAGHQKSYGRVVALDTVPLDPVHVPTEVGGAVPATLSLTLGATASFGSFAPGVAKTYTASTTANVLSTAGDAALSVSEPGRLANGSFTLASPLRVAFSKAAWTEPVSNDVVTVSFEQDIAANEPLRTGAYSKTLTFTLSTIAP